MSSVEVANGKESELAGKTHDVSMSGWSWQKELEQATKEATWPHTFIAPCSVGSDATR